MVDYTSSKQYKNAGVYPVEVSEVSELFRRSEALITPELLKSRYLKGIPKMDYSDEELKDFINRAANCFESESGLTVERVQYIERLPFDKALYASYVYTKTNHFPITSIESFHVTSSNGQNIFSLPASWTEVGFAHRGQINVLPILSVFGSSGFDTATNATSAGLIFLRAISNYTFLPAFWEVIYTAGLSKSDGTIPLIVNEVIGAAAAIEILSSLQARILDASSSISQDSLGQSTSKKGGGDVYKARIEDLTIKKDKTFSHLMKNFSHKIWVSNL